MTTTVAIEPPQTSQQRRQVRLCECGEFTYAPECAQPCRLPSDQVPPMPPTAITVPSKWCGCLLGDNCGCGPFATHTDLGQHRAGR